MSYFFDMCPIEISSFILLCKYKALFPKSKAERRLAPSTVKISLLLCGRYLKREEVAGQVKVGLKFFYKVQKLAIISLGTVTDL